MRRFFSALRDAWLVVGVVLLLAVLGEYVPDLVIGARHFLKQAGAEKRDFRAGAEGYGGADWVDAYWREYFSVVKARWAPYVHWKLLPVDGRYIKVEADGNRHTWAPAGLNAHGKSPRIFVYGSSTTFGMGARDDFTVPSHLAKLLAARGAAAKVTNWGQPGWNSTQDMIQFIEHIHEGKIPDIAVFYGGAADAGSLRVTGIVGDPANVANRLREFNLVSGHRNAALAAETVRAYFPRLLRRADEFADFLGLVPEKPDRPFPEADIPARTDQVIRLYADNVAAVRRFAAAHGVKVLFVWQPLVYSKDHLSPHEKRYQDTGTWPALYKELRRARQRSTYLENLADAIDLSDVFDRTEGGVFVDFSHLTERGNEIVAEAILPYVMERLGAK